MRFFTKDKGHFWCLPYRPLVDEPESMLDYEFEMYKYAVTFTETAIIAQNATRLTSNFCF